MAQVILTLMTVAGATAWLLRGWIAPPLRRALAGRGTLAAQVKGSGCDDCSCGR